MDEVWTPPKLVSWITQDLQKRGLPPSHRLEAELLVSKALDISRLDLFLQFDRPVTEEERGKVKALLQRRRLREPVAYIVGNAHFWNLELFVGPGVLIPRSDTENLVDKTLEWLKATDKGQKRKVIELGAGSLCISLSLATELMGLEICALEASAEAFKYAQKNLDKYQEQLAELENKIHLILADSFGVLDEVGKDTGEIDLIISNPPYIAVNELAALQEEVRDFEPTMALEAGETGLDFYHLLASEAEKRLVHGGCLAFEHGSTQKEEILTLMQNYTGLQIIEHIKDLSGLDRGMLWEKK
ncbi:MAG: peptide chain release factor N(5)-glutamine methyltransferase [SAR324 cluster bacterium]|nr:peptide chain release factor N(5)-glutamine methyltransferase [SAR324 cluster bacterium]